MRRFPMHPHAQEAVKLAILLHGENPSRITRRLNESSCPRRLFVIAAELEAQHQSNLSRTGRFVNVTA